jgi:hypothetical protein
MPRAGSCNGERDAQLAGRRADRGVEVPPPASRKSAVSRTPRVSAPVTESPFQHLAHRHAVALRLEAEQPAAPAGIGSSPPPSLPSAAAAGPAATAAPSRRSTRPGVRAGSHGLWVAPNASDSVAHIASSSARVSCREHAAGGAQAAHDLRVPAGRPPCASEPRIVTWPATSVSSLIAIGTPLSGGARALRAARVRLVGGGERLLGEHHAVAAQERVEPLDAVEVRCDELPRGDPPVATSSAWRASRRRRDRWASTARGP